ncbi:hypothetical protein NIES267_11700 [Calothrix parasitica NIES-267]|uniref:Uncharacterized protein n=1 Tax=Calothrix parasitica NIES-267 TaxID=1973488 RepID=A0A1Z4LKC9_9CYAN|nr:hypothetical protein NIES267_11700 [Calothrix parasitica NIES-267]
MENGLVQNGEVLERIKNINSPPIPNHVGEMHFKENQIGGGGCY